MFAIIAPITGLVAVTPDLCIEVPPMLNQGGVTVAEVSKSTWKRN